MDRGHGSKASPYKCHPCHTPRPIKPAPPPRRTWPAGTAAPGEQGSPSTASPATSGAPMSWWAARRWAVCSCRSQRLRAQEPPPQPDQRALVLAPIIPRNQSDSDDLSNLQSLCFRRQAGPEAAGLAGSWLCTPLQPTHSSLSATSSRSWPISMPPSHSSPLPTMSSASFDFSWIMRSMRSSTEPLVMNLCTSTRLH